MERLQRIGMGLVAMFLASALLTFIPVPNHVLLPDLLVASLATFLAATVGAYVAKHGFLLPAVSFILIQWVWAMYEVHRIAAQYGGAHFFAVALGVVPQLLILIIAACLGVQFGYWSRGRKPSSNTAAT